MGCVFQKQVTRPIPPSATITTQQGKRVAKWRNRSGGWSTGEIGTRDDGTEFIRVESGTYYAKYRDADGVVQVVSTGCRSEQTARQALARLERDTERVKIGVVTTSELAIADASTAPITEAINAYIGTLTGSAMHRENTRGYLNRLAESLNWHRITDLKREDLERWLADQTRSRRSARSRNAYQTSAKAFANWCVRSSRLTSNPFGGMSRANEDADRRRQRRALTPEEFQSLMLAAQSAPERPETENARNSRRPALRLTGEERAEVYAVLAGTGLRVGELTKLRVADVRLDDRVPNIELPARITKNGTDATIPLRTDLVNLLRRRVNGQPPSAPLYSIPADFIKRFNADCRRAGIPKRDERGRTIDLHALRTTFGTWLARSGVAPRTAQSLMRHSDIRLTMSVYTDPKLLDTAAAVESLPAVAPASATNSCVAPSVAPAPAISGATQTSAVTTRRQTIAS